MLKLSEENQAVLRVLKNTLFTKETLILVILGAALFASALTVIYVKNWYRQQFIALQEQYQLHNELDVEWAQLLLEKSTWEAQSHVQSVAEGQLDMVVPTTKEEQLLVVQTGS